MAHLKRLVPGVSEDEAWSYADKVFMSKKETMDILLRWIGKEYGGAYGYAKVACGLSDVQLRRIQQLLVER